MGGGGEHGALKSPHRAIVARTGVGTLGCGGRGGCVCPAVPYRVPCMLCHRCGTRTLSRYRNACLHTHTAFPGHMAPPPAGPGPSCCPPTTWLEEVETGECQGQSDLPLSHPAPKRDLRCRVHRAQHRELTVPRGELCVSRGTHAAVCDRRSPPRSVGRACFRGCTRAV